MEQKNQQPLGALTVAEFIQLIEPLIHQSIEKVLTKTSSLKPQKPPHLSNNLIGKKEIARRFNVHVQTVSNWQIQKVKLGRLVFYRESDIQKWIENNQTNQTKK